MVTRITFKYANPRSNPKESTEYDVPFYCVEKPIEVLNGLISKHHVIKYNSIVTDHLDAVVSTKKNTPKELIIHGINIEHKLFDNSGTPIVTTNSWRDFSPSVSSKTFSDYNLLIESFVKKYLIDIKILDYGSYNLGTASKEFNNSYFSQTQLARLGRQKASSYMDTRGITKNPIKEDNLEDILRYGKAVLGREFDKWKILLIANRILRSIPETFDPRPGYSIQKF